MTYKILNECLACGHGDLKQFCDLGEQPLANGFVAPGDAAPPLYPLELVHCTECYHAQLTVVVDPDVLYKDYPYVSGTSATLKRYFDDFAARVEADTANKDLYVLDIASNDGSLLRAFQRLGHKHLFGVDPAGNLRPDDIPTHTGYWDKTALAVALERTERRGYDVIVAMNVLGHVAEPLEFLRLCKLALVNGGRIYIQTSQARMLTNGEFDTVYHEHLSYFTPSSWYALARRAGLYINKMEISDIHGGSWLLEMTVDALPYKNFEWRVSAAIETASFAIGTYYQAGYKIVGYGAAAKGMTFLNTVRKREIEMCRQRGTDAPKYVMTMDCVIDDSPNKLGKLCPGVGVPVIGAHVIDNLPEKTLFVILAWNFTEEIKERIYKARTKPEKFKFMTCFPEVRVG